jgi:hypothetical protein
MVSRGPHGQLLDKEIEMKSIVLPILLAVSASANADAISDATSVCINHMQLYDGTHAGDYPVGFEHCAPLVAKWIAERKAEIDAKARKQRAQDIATINKGLQAAGLPLISE